jgi:SAM-dependent methyltransferase
MITFAQQQLIRPGNRVLNTLYQYDDFMESIKSIVDLGCGSGLDLEWWATASTRDDSPVPLNISCLGIDVIDTPAVARKYSNATYQQVDFETEFQPQKTNFDILWCNDAFQYCLNPMSTLGRWRKIAATGAMIVLIVPQTTNFKQKQQQFFQPSGCYYHHTMISLIHMLATTGWDCRNGFFLPFRDESWNCAVAYKSEHEPLDPKTTTWYQLDELGLLPESVSKSVKAHGYPVQHELLLPWLDKSLNYLL